MSRNKGSSLRGAPSPLGSLMRNSLAGTSLPASAQGAKSPLAGSLSPFAASFSDRSGILAQVRSRGGEGGREGGREKGREGEG